MRKILFTLFLLSISITSYGQWTNTQRQQLYDLAANSLTSNKGLSPEQQKVLSKCFMKKISEELTPADFNSKIEIELEDIYDSAIDRCAKELGLTFASKKAPQEATKKPEKLEINFANLEGHWIADGGTDLYLMGNSEFVLNWGTSIEKGKWSIEGSKLSMIGNDIFARQYKRNVLSLTTTELSIDFGKQIIKFKKS
jgi:hypothetical protein